MRFNMLRKLLPLVASLGAALTLVTAYQGTSTAGTVDRASVSVSEQAAVPAKAAPLKRHIAMRAALSKAGGWYRYGGNGPSSYDCSGLVMAAYNRAGISLPRVADAQRGSSKTVGTNLRHARWGDLVFWGGGHVELFGHRMHRNGKLVGFVSFGAHHSGTRISYRVNYLSSSYTQRATFRYVAGAGAR
jgi:cell wall-associated NlpC family hydrolase